MSCGGYGYVVIYSTKWPIDSDFSTPSKTVETTTNTNTLVLTSTGPATSPAEVGAEERGTANASGVIAGTVFAGVFLVGLLALLFVCCKRRAKKKKKQKQNCHDCIKPSPVHLRDKDKDEDKVNKTNCSSSSTDRKSFNRKGFDTVGVTGNLPRRPPSARSVSSTVSNRVEATSASTITVYDILTTPSAAVVAELGEHAWDRRRHSMAFQSPGSWAEGRRLSVQEDCASVPVGRPEEGGEDGGCGSSSGYWGSNDGDDTPEAKHQKFGDGDPLLNPDIEQPLRIRQGWGEGCGGWRILGSDSDAGSVDC
jgi:hypothetical protein